MENVYRTLAQYGGKNTRFGSVLSGNPNINVLQGSPTGGTTGIVSKYFQDPAKIGAGRRKSRRMRGGASSIVQGDTMDTFLRSKGLNFRPYVLDQTY